MKLNIEILSKDEQKVMDILEKNAKDSIENLAKQCGFSRQKVWRIIKNLEQNKIIWGYTAIADEEVTGMKHFVLLVKRNTQPLSPSLKKEVILKKLDEYLPGQIKIETILVTHGSYTGVVSFYAPDLIIAKKFQQILFQRIGTYIDEYLLLETLFSIRKQGLKNPNITDMVEFI